MTEGSAGELIRLRGELQAARLQLQELEQRNARLERRVQAEQQSAVLFANQLQDLRRSRSWQVTAPLRALARRSRG